jgi:LPS-assembly lipoprotein
MRRRRLLAAAPLALAGCGFELRRAPVVPFKALTLSGFAPGSPMAEELTRQLAPGTRIVKPPAEAQAVLQALVDVRERSVVASTAAGQVRELQLRVRLEFKLTHPGGRELIPATELRASRDMSYSESLALAKEQEETQLFAAMHTDIALQVLRRLARVGPPA